MNCLPRILLVSLTLSTATPSFSSNIKLDNKTIAYAGAAAVAVGGISYAAYKGYKASINSKLYKAIWEKDLAEVKNALEKGADANACWYFDYVGSKKPMLAMAVSGGNVAIVEELIAHGADVNAKMTFGKGSPVAGLRAFFDGRPITETEQLKDESVIVIAACYGDIDIVKSLLAHGANIESTGDKDATPLIEAACCGYADLVTFLLKHGANINAQDERGKTALIHAVERHGKLKVVLHWADDESYRPTYFENSQIIKALIEHGADVNIKDKSGNTALQYAQENGFTEIAELLKAHGATE